MQIVKRVLARLHGVNLSCQDVIQQRSIVINQSKEEEFRKDGDKEIKRKDKKMKRYLMISRLISKIKKEGSLWRDRINLRIKFLVTIFVIM